MYSEDKSSRYVPGRIFAEFSNEVSTFSFLSNHYFKKIESEFPQFLDDVLDMWLFTYNIEDSKRHNRYATLLANNEVREVYKLLKNNKDNYLVKEFRKPQRLDELILILSKDDCEDEISDYADQKNDASTAEETKKVNVHEIYRDIDENYPEFSRDARDLRDREYDGQKSKNIPKGTIDVSAMKIADKKLKDFYQRIKQGCNYEREELDVDINPEEIIDYIHPLIDDIKENHPDYYADAVEDWIYNVKRMYVPEEGINHNSNSVKAANKRLKLYHKKLKDK